MKIKVRIKIRPEKVRNNELCISSLDNTIYLHNQNDK